MDGLADALISAAAPVGLNIARTETERRALYRLRYRAALGRGWADVADLPDRLERDAYDDRATHVGGWHDGSAVACARVLFPIPGAMLPVEEVFGLELKPHAQVAHFDRFCIAREYGDGRDRLLLALLAYCWLLIRRRGLVVSAGITSRAMLRIYQSLGLNVVQLAPPRRYWGEQRVPILFNGRDPGSLAGVRRALETAKVTS